MGKGKEKARIAFARAAAKKLLKDNRVEEPPVPVELLARGQGFDPHLVLLPQGVDGRMVVDRSAQMMEVAEDHPLVRQRFTIAHELGHRLLAHHLRETSAQEEEAQAFANELLVPRDWLRRDLRSRPTPAIGVLAARYQVSTHVIFIAAERGRMLDLLQR
ncbi:MAG: ImmA/IrrE family metallo-endopeptidase [Actinobacteria bacterium]|nr:ImmA/IrrE family metallo-endopeptidase [Actinomycetota bacterium]